MASFNAVTNNIYLVATIQIIEISRLLHQSNRSEGEQGLKDHRPGTPHPKTPP